MLEENNNAERTSAKVTDDMDGGPIEGHLNSDNAFSDKGLNNADLTRKALKKNVER